MINTFYTRYIIPYKVLVLLAFAALIFLSLKILPGIRKDSNPFLLPDTHQAKISLQKMKDMYTGSNDRVVVLLEAPDTIFKQDTLASIARVTEEITQINVVSEDDIAYLKALSETADGEAKSLLDEITREPTGLDALTAVEELLMVYQNDPEKRADYLRIEKYRNRLNPIIEVTSLANIDNIVGTSGDLEISALYDHPPATAQELESLKNAVLENELFFNRVISADGKLTVIAAEVSIHVADPEANYELYNKINEIVEENIHLQHYIAGVPVTSSTISVLLKKDMAKSFPLVILLVMVFLYVTLRKVKGIIIPMLVVFLTILMTMAVQVIFDIPITIVNSTLPVFLICIGVADGIHIFSEFRAYRHEGMEKNDAIAKTMSKLFVPLTLTSVTTAIAFLSLSQSAIVQVKEFGIFVSVGTIIALFLSLLLVPALISLLPEFKIKAEKPKPALDRFLDSSLLALTRWVVRNPGKVLAVAGLIAAISSVGITRIIVDNDRTEYFKPDTELVQGATALNEKFSGSTSISLLIQKDEEKAFMQPEALQTIDKLQRFIDKQEYVGRTFSIVDIFKRMNKVLHSNSEDYNTIPFAESQDVSGSDLIAQYVLLYENGADDLSDSVQSDFREINLRVGLTTNSTHELEKLIAKIDAYMDENLPESYMVHYAGTAYVNLAGSKEIIYGQVKSFIVSVVLVLIILAIAYRSISLGIIGTLPLLFAIFTNYGYMGLFGVELNIGTALVSTVAIGIGVDYSIHYLSRLQVLLNQGLSAVDAMNGTIQYSGKAIVVNALTVGTGFLALLFSEFTPIVTIGWTVSLTMITCCLSSLVLIPAVLMVVKPARIYRSAKATVDYSMNNAEYAVAGTESKMDKDIVTE